MGNPLLKDEITKVLGVDKLSTEEQISFVSEIGALILETALFRFAPTLTSEQHLSLEQYLETEPDPEVLLGHLLEHHESFKNILEDVVLDFKEDAITVLGSK